MQADSGVFNTTEAEAEAQPEQQKPTTVLDIYQNRGTKQGESTVVDTDPTTHTEAQQAVINDYQNSTDGWLVSFVDRVRSLKDPNYRNKITYTISIVSSKQAQDIKAVTGVDVTGFENIITGDAVTHIDQRHGVDGEHDNSMADVNDLARIGYVLDNYDSVVLSTNSDGTPRTSKRWRNGDNSGSPQVIFQKKIDGTMYVVEAVPDNKRNALAVVTAYIQKNSGSEGTVPNISQSEPQPYVQNDQRSNSPATDTVTQEAPSVNMQNEAETETQADADGDGLYGRSVGAATPRRGEQVESRLADIALTPQRPSIQLHQAGLSSTGSADTLVSAACQKSAFFRICASQSLPCVKGGGSG